MMFEYRLVTLGEFPGNWEDRLNEHGKAGWELVTIVGGQGAILKRAAGL
jgi:hypothetical protein